MAAERIPCLAFGVMTVTITGNRLEKFYMEMGHKHAYKFYIKHLYMVTETWRWCETLMLYRINLT